MIFGRSPGSGGELLAAMGTPARQNLAPARRGHARTKTMAPLADDLARLIRAFHGGCSGLTKGAGFLESRPGPVNRRVRPAMML